MARRLNPHRRLLAKQMALRRTLVTAGNADDAGKLQQGAVRSPLTTIYRGHVAPRPASWEGTGTPGKVTRGQFKRSIPGTKSRFDNQPRHVAGFEKHPFGVAGADVEPRARQDVPVTPAKEAFDAIMSEPKKAPIIDD